jgi:hypothetical protein
MGLLPKLASKWLLSLFLFPSNLALANSFSSTAGYYSIAAKTSSGTENLKNFGVYRFIYDIEVGDKFAFRPSYSIYTISSDAGLEFGYGTDIEFSYMPLTRNGSMNFQNSNVSWRTFEVFRPYVSISFHQRQYQDIQSNYAGLGLQAGTSYQYDQSIYILAYAASIFLSGPLSSRINEFQFAGGIGMNL